MSRRVWWWAVLLLALLVPSGQAQTDEQGVPAGGTIGSPEPMRTVLGRMVSPGQVISLDFQDASVHAILRSFAECGRVNIVASPDIKGRATVALKEVPWATGLEMVLKANGLAAVEEGGVLRVNSAQALANEELSLHSAERRKEELLPLTTKLVPLVYAKADELKLPLQKMLSPRGTLEVDPRTNTLLVVDIAQNVARIEDMIAALDSNTPQVEITAKLLDVDAAAMKDLGVSWQATGLTRDGVDATGEASVNAPVASAAGAFKITTLASDADIEMTLQALQRDNKARIISNPRITTLDNQEAKIIVGKKIPLVVTDEAGNAITQLTTIGIKMSVTPHINSDDWVTLELHPEVSDLSAQATVQGGIIIVTAEASTRVVVKDGQTAVIGGLIRENQTEYVTGVPVFKSLPLLGHLFRSTSTTTEQRELIIFVTPRIIRQG